MCQLHSSCMHFMCQYVFVHRQELWRCCIEVGIGANWLGTADVGIMQGQYCFTLLFHMLSLILGIEFHLFQNIQIVVFCCVSTTLSALSRRKQVVKTIWRKAASRPPKKLPLLLGDWAPLNAWFLGLTRDQTQKNVTISLVVFVRLMS